MAESRVVVVVVVVAAAVVSVAVTTSRDSFPPYRVRFPDVPEPIQDQARYQGHQARNVVGAQLRKGRMDVKGQVPQRNHQRQSEVHEIARSVL